MRKYIRFYRLSDIPVDFGSKNEWNRRGYKIPLGASESGYASHWNGMYYLNFKVYHLSQCVPISGIKAGDRRVDYWKLWEANTGAGQCS